MNKIFGKPSLSGLNNLIQAINAGLWLPGQVGGAMYNMPGITSLSIRAGSEYGLRLCSLCKDLGMRMKFVDPFIVPCTQIFKFKQYKGILIDSTMTGSEIDSKTQGPEGRLLLAFPNKIDVEEFRKDVFDSTKPTNTLVVKTYGDGWKGRRKPFTPSKQPLCRELKSLLKNIATSPKVLLYGIPGTGKTTFGKHAAHYYSRDLALISNTKDFDKAISELGTDDVVMLEDIDVLLEKDPSIVHTLMQFLDGVLSNEEQIIICTTNKIDRIPPTLMRPGRFTEYLELGYISDDHLKTLCRINNWEYDSYKELAGKATVAEVLFGSNPV